MVTTVIQSESEVSFTLKPQKNPRLKIHQRNYCQSSDIKVEVDPKICTTSNYYRMFTLLANNFS